MDQIMKITINGEAAAIEPCTIAQLVRQRNLKPETVVVELNMQIVKQEQWPQTQLKDGDTLELLSFVGGG